MAAIASVSIDLSKIDKCLIYAETANYTEDCTHMIRIDKIIPKLKKIAILVNSDVTPIKTLFGIKVFSAFHLRSPIRYCFQEEDAVKWLNYSKLNNLKSFFKKLLPFNSF